MKVRIDAEGEGLPAAIEFSQKHVIVSKRDLDRIKRLAKKHGLYEELKKLNVKMQEFAL